jgi:AraC-like DNA-binding protein
MSTLHSSLYAVALISCLLLLFVARKVLRDTRHRAKYLFALLLLLTSNFAFEWLMSNPSTPAKPLWLALVMAVAFFLAPCLWLHARSIVEPVAPRLRDLPRAHLLPIALGLLLLVPLVERTHLGTGFAHPHRGTNAAYAVVVHGAMLAAVFVFALQALYYLKASLVLLKRHARAARVLLSDVEDGELNTLRLLIFVVGAHWIVGIARTLHPLMLGKDAGFVVLFAISEVMVSVWAMFALMRGAVSVQAGDRQLASEIADAKYARSALDDVARSRIVRKLSEAWTVRRLHLDSRLSLRVLCEQVRENPHYVSQVINQDLGTNFYDLVNRHRIREAQLELLRHPDRPVLEIALQVAFNSKSTFNAAFRQHAGMTPSEFRHMNAPSGSPATSDPAG